MYENLDAVQNSDLYEIVLISKEFITDLASQFHRFVAEHILIDYLDEKANLMNQRRPIYRSSLTKSTQLPNIK